MKSADAPARAPHPIHARFARALREARIMVWIADAEGGRVFMNRKWLTFTGRRMRDQLGNGWTMSVHPDDLGSCLDTYRSAVIDRRPGVLEYRLRRFDHVYRRICECAMPVHDENGRFTGYVGTCIDVTAEREGTAARDVTRQRELEQERDAQIAMLNGLIAHMSDGVLAETSDHQLAVVNAAFNRIFGLPPALWRADSAPALRQMACERLVNAGDCCTTGDDLFPRGELRLKDGRILEQQHFSVPLASGHAIQVWQFRDITVRKREEDELVRSRHRLRDLSAHLETAREEERRDLARTLHDEVGQLLTGIRLEVSGAVERFRQVGTPAEFPVVDRLQAAVGLVDLSIATIQRVTGALRPPMLDHLGLLSAIKWEAAVFRRRTGIRCRVSTGTLRDEHHDHSTVLYRILLEALTNVARHANAGTVWISLRQRPGRLVMEIRDNGRGITDEALVRPGAMGLLGMRERAIAAGGELRVSRRPTGGTSVVVTLPLTAADAAGGGHARA